MKIGKHCSCRKRRVLECGSGWQCPIDKDENEDGQALYMQKRTGYAAAVGYVPENCKYCLYA